MAPTSTMKTLIPIMIYAAAIIANLHTQATGVQSIRSLVPVVLDPISSHYNRWPDFVLLSLEQYTLIDNVLFNVPRLSFPSWR
jgi:hypothetical protein